MIFKLFYPLFIVLFFTSVFINKNNLFTNISSSVDNFNFRFNKDIQMLKNEIDFLNATKKTLPFVNYKVDKNIVYFDINGSGIYFKNTISYPNHFNFYNLKEAKKNLNSQFDNSLLFITYNNIISLKNNKTVIYTDDFSQTWVKVLQKGSLSLNIFKTERSISRNNTEFALYNVYTDRPHNKEMFTIIFPEYDYFDNSQKICSLWYFDFDSNFFAKNTNILKNILGLNVYIIDGNHNVVYSTEKKHPKFLKSILDFYVFPLEKTNYKILIEKESIFQLIKIKEILFLTFIIFLMFYINKKEKLKKELNSLKMINKIKSELLLKDPLTALYNRYFLQEEMNFPIKNCGVVLLDIDHFKNINDSFGHDKGDLVLKAVSNYIKLVSIGSADAFRWGGEEFLIIFKNTNEEKLLNKTRTLQTLIKNLNIIDNYKITASFGVIYTDIKDKNTFYKAISKADKNLYAAKKTGRDKIVF